MSFPLEGLRKSYYEEKKSPSNFDDEDLFDMGYSADDIDKIKGKE
jgi:hypothetical protein